MIGVGDRAPDFLLATAAGTQVSLGEFLAKGPLVLYFYPKDYTPGCTAEACAFRDAYSVFLDAGAQVLGVSNDSVESHKNFAEKHALPFPLASDPDGSVRAAYGIPKTLGLLPGRATFVIDREGVIASAFNSQFAPQKHIDTALAVLKTLA
jgi:peroxiredoxin Q/BCP